MLKSQAAFSSVTANDLAEAKKFYTETLGLTLDDETMGLNFKLPGGGGFFIYEKTDHQAPAFTVLNFVVDNIDEAASELTKLGVTFERYDNLPGKQDDKGVLRGLSLNYGPDIAWFKDPSGNILSVIQNK
ncbi:MAG TPA: VOC family protein [Candidatus Saccharimonadales bacterium]|jgi:catechol 2,3-dioxygenase-like lactoylglutathione lyase family enzyme